MRKLLAVLSVFLLGAPALNAQNLLTNGTLDLTYQQVIVDNAPLGSDSGEDFLLPKPDGWVNEGTRVITGPYEDEMSSEPWAGPAPTPVTTGGLDGGDWAVFFKPFSGDLLTNGPATGHLYQDVPGSAGNIYTLTGWAGAEPNYLSAGSQFAIEFLDGGGNIIGTSINALAALIVDNGEPFDYKQYTVVGVSPVGTATVRARASMLGATANPAGGGQAFVIDDFVLTSAPVPEPAAVALLGLGFVGLVAARRRK